MPLKSARFQSLLVYVALLVLASSGCKRFWVFIATDSTSEIIYQPVLLHELAGDIESYMGAYVYFNCFFEELDTDHLTAHDESGFFDQYREVHVYDSTRLPFYQTRTSRHILAYHTREDRVTSKIDKLPANAKITVWGRVDRIYRRPVILIHKFHERRRYMFMEPNKLSHELRIQFEELYEDFLFNRYEKCVTKALHMLSSRDLPKELETELLYVVAKSLLAVHDYERARHFYAEVYKIGKTDRDFLYEYAECLFELGEDDAAMRALNDASHIEASEKRLNEEMMRQLPRRNFILGRMYLERGIEKDLHLVEYHLQIAEKAGIENPEFMLEFTAVKGMLFDANLELERAGKYYNEVVGHFDDPHMRDRFWAKIAAFRMKRGRYDDAFDIFEKTVSLDVDDKYHYMVTAINLGKFALARNLGETLVSNLKATAYRTAWRAPIDDNAPKYDPKLVLVYEKLGVAYENLDMPTRAYAVYEEALRLDPDYQSVIRRKKELEERIRKDAGSFN